MDVRETLVGLIFGSLCRHIHKSCKLAENIADDLIANGVTVAYNLSPTEPLTVCQQWIPVTERLPEICDKDPDWSKTVLFRTVFGHIHSGYRNIGRPQTSVYDDDWTPPYWIDESENLYFEEDEVTHWMPLPEPPKENDNG